jgi:ABC-2 type transport system ATP-binding protein
MAERVVDARGLGRRFGRRWALADVDLEVAEGEIVGLVGPNGSGKTTLLRLLAGLLRPHRGTVQVLGGVPWNQRHQVMRAARFAFAPPALFDTLTPREHLRELPRLGGDRVDDGALEQVLALVGLSERADDRVGTFSFGMRQRLALALALLPRPRLLVLDEPTEGLDPLAVLELRAILARLRSEHGLAILLSSHLLVEIDRLVDRLLVLREGRTRFHGTPADLRAGTRRLVLTVDRPEVIAAALRAEAEVEVVLDEDGALRLPAEHLTLDEARALCANHGVGLLGFHHRVATLEEALLTRLREEAG